MKKLFFTNLGVILLSLLIVFMGTCKRATIKNPTIISVVVFPDYIEKNGIVTVSVTATDSDGDALTYFYSVSGGTIVGNGATATWTAPAVEGEYSVSVTVTNDKGGVAGSSATLIVLPI